MTAGKMGGFYGNGLESHRERGVTLIKPIVDAGINLPLKAGGSIDCRVLDSGRVHQKNKK